MAYTIYAIRKLFIDGGQMSKGLGIATIIAVGMVLAVITYKSLDYYSEVALIEKSKAKTFDPFEKQRTKKWIPAKSLEECMKGRKVIDNFVHRCRNGYYKAIYINKDHDK